MKVVGSVSLLVSKALLMVIGLLIATVLLTAYPSMHSGLTASRVRSLAHLL